MWLSTSRILHDYTKVLKYKQDPVPLKGADLLGLCAALLLSHISDHSLFISVFSTFRPSQHTEDRHSPYVLSQVFKMFLQN